MWPTASTKVKVGERKINGRPNRSPLGEGAVSHLSASMADAGCLREYNRALRGMRREGACHDFTSPAERKSQPQRDVPKARKWPAANAKTFARSPTLPQ